MKRAGGCALVCCAVLFGCHGPQVDDSKAPKPWPTKMEIPPRDPNRPISAQLNAREVAQLQRQGWGGDPESALLLRQYFGETSSAVNEIEKWERISAENGSSVGAALLASRLTELGGEQNCLRAKFWLERAASEFSASNPPAGVEVNIELEVLAEKWAQCVERGTKVAG